MTRLCIALATALVASAAAATEAAYTLDSSHTFVSFEVLHEDTSTVRGRFERTEATISFDPAQGLLKVDATIDPASVSTGVRPLDAALRGRNFLDVANFPSASFASTGAVFAEGRPTSVTGQLTLLGKSLPVTLDVVRFNCRTSGLFRREVCGGDFETTIVRSRWGMGYGVKLGVADEVRLLIQIEAIRQ